MSRIGLQGRVGPASLFLHAARRHPLGHCQRTAILLQRPFKLRSKVAPGLRTGAARSLRHAHESIFQSDLPPRLEISRTDAARSNLATFSQRRSALIVAYFFSPRLPLANSALEMRDRPSDFFNPWFRLVLRVVCVLAS